MLQMVNLHSATAKVLIPAAVFMELREQPGF
jgi:hypothetical protein